MDQGLESQNAPLLSLTITNLDEKFKSNRLKYKSNGFKMLISIQICPPTIITNLVNGPRPGITESLLSWTILNLDKKIQIKWIEI